MTSKYPSLNQTLAFLLKFPNIKISVRQSLTFIHYSAANQHISNSFLPYDQMSHSGQLLNDLPGDCAVHLVEEDIWTESDKILPPSHLPVKYLD